MEANEDRTVRIDRGAETITEFLEARIAEDEADALGASRQKWRAKGWVIEYAQRVLAECAAKRAIITAQKRQEDDDDDMAWIVASEVLLKSLAAVYKDHPDYRPEWA